MTGEVGTASYKNSIRECIHIGRLCSYCLQNVFAKESAVSYRDYVRIEEEGKLGRNVSKILLHMLQKLYVKLQYLLIG